MQGLSRTMTWAAAKKKGSIEHDAREGRGKEHQRKKTSLEQSTIIGVVVVRVRRPITRKVSRSTT